MTRISTNQEYSRLYLYGFKIQDRKYKNEPNLILFEPLALKPNKIFKKSIEDFFQLGRQYNVTGIETDNIHKLAKEVYYEFGVQVSGKTILGVKTEIYKFLAGDRQLQRLFKFLVKNPTQLFQNL